MTTKQQLHVVFGAGQIGSRLSSLLAADGHRVRVVQRSQPKQPRPGIEALSGDVTDLTFAAEAGRGADVIYDCMNPPYHQWQQHLLSVAKGSLHAAKTSGARLVALDCLYSLGRPVTPMREDTPFNPQSKKGELRVQLQQLRSAATRAGDARVTSGRASDFFGPNLPFSQFGPRLFTRLLAGKTGELTGNPDHLHSYTYADDVAAGLRTLGAHPETTDEIWHLPTVAPVTSRELVRRLGQRLGVQAEVVKLPAWLLRVLGIFEPLLSETIEMSYQWEGAFIIDDSKFRAAFGVQPTPLEQQLDETAAWALKNFAPRRQRAAPLTAAR